MGLIHSLKRIADDFIFSQNPARKHEPRIIIPYGRHSYGPQPKIISVGEGVRRKARGSKVGSFCALSFGLKFVYLDKHNYNWLSTYPFYAFYNDWKFDLPPAYNKGVLDTRVYTPNPIIIENDVWIAANVTINKGVTIGNGAVVAMDSLVVKNVPPYAIVGGGVPAEIIRYRFRPEQIEQLLKIAWWNWKDKEIKQVVPFFDF
jgi:virginiamycin A acetyltransferase